MIKIAVRGLAAFALSALLLPAQNSNRLLIMGDSISEGVQGADANLRTQIYTYGAFIAKQRGTVFTQPYINSCPSCIIFDTAGRTRINPSEECDNLAVSGSDTTKAITVAADDVINEEEDLVLMPRKGTQLSIALASPVKDMIYWLGNGDVLDATLAWDQMDASQVTPISQVESTMETAFSQMRAAGKRWLMAGVPDVSRIGFLFSNKDLIRFVGSDFGFPDGYRTSGAAAILIKTGTEDPNVILNDENYFLNPTELAKLHQDVLNINATITAKAQQYNIPMVDIYSLYEQMATTPPVYGGVKLYTYFNGGIESLDGVHPSTTSHALIANEFIKLMNQHWGQNIPLLTEAQLNEIALNDPHIDFDGDNRVKGRPLAGLLETLGPIVGISGDFNENPSAEKVKPGIDPTLGPKLVNEYRKLKGLPAGPVTKADVRKVVAEMFGLKSRR